MPEERLTYAAAGVDIAAGERAVDLLRGHVRRTARPEVRGDPSGFAGLFRFDRDRYREPVLATSTDGVGTKVVLAQRLGVHDTVGLDLVGMVVDDLVVCGAEPLFMTDYIACGRLVPEVVAELVAGVADGCRQAGCALLGGETAEHPGMLTAGEYDLAGAATGVVDAAAMLGPDRVRAGDAVLALASSGPHSNGYSLIRRVVEVAGLDLDEEPAELAGYGPLGPLLLTPTRIYAADCLALADHCDVHAYAHITGGGLAANLGRSLPDGLDAVLDRAAWSPEPLFGFLGACGGIADAELESTFNMGVGMAAIVASDDADEAVRMLNGRGVPARPIGEVTEGAGAARLIGTHP